MPAAHKHHLLTIGLILYSAGGALAQPQGSGGGWLPPPFEMKFLPGWRTEHVAFAMCQNGRFFGGPARWAVGGSRPHMVRPVEQADKLYLGVPGEGVQLYFHDKLRIFWKLEGSEIWPIAGGNDLGDSLYGSGEFSDLPQGDLRRRKLPCCLARLP